MRYTNQQIIRAAARFDHHTFSRAAFFWAYKKQRMESFHLRLISKLCDEILAGKRRRVLICIPPRHAKTEEICVMLNGRVFAVNPAARNLHLSYSDQLVHKNSRRLKALCNSPQYGEIFPEFQMSKQAFGQVHWETTMAGEFHTATMNGQVTGFECGDRGDPFDGILSIDDPQKSQDMTSRAKRNTTKDLIGDYIATRLNHPLTPVVAVQQRLGMDDVANWLLSGGTGDVWDTLVLQGLSDDGLPPKQYLEYSHCNLLQYRRPPGALWPERKSIASLLALRDATESDDSDDPRGARNFASQYQQLPADSSIALFQNEWIGEYAEKEIPVTLSDVWIRIDTAQKGTGKSDHHGLVVFGADRRDKSRVYVLDAHRKRCEFPELLKWGMERLEHVLTYESQSIRFSGVIIEDANIGAALKSSLEVKLKEKKIRIRIDLTPKYGNKFDRALEALPYIQQGRVLFPAHRTRFVSDHTMAGLKALRNEYKEFNEADTHASDDLLDPVMWEIVTRYGNAPGYDRFIYGAF